MKAAKMAVRPGFSLMKQTDIQSVYHMQMPRWLFSDPRYCGMSLDAKVAYTFLLNRFQLSRMNGWVNEYGEVFVVFPRKEMAAELRVGEKRVTAAFRELAEHELIWEKRCGLCAANQIYLAQVQPLEDPDYQCAPFLKPAGPDGGSGSVKTAVQEPTEGRLRNSGQGVSGEVERPVLEPPDLPCSKKETRKELWSQKEVSQSYASGGGQTDDDEAELTDILDACELGSFSPETARVFENAIERLFYSDSFRVGNAVLPRGRVRSKLHLLNDTILQDAEAKMAANRSRAVKNSTAYTMSLIFNAITESDSDLLVDPYLNSLRNPP